MEVAWGAVRFGAAAIAAAYMLGWLGGRFGQTLIAAGISARGMLASVLALTALSLLAELGRWRLMLPHRGWQIPRGWAAWGRVPYQVMFGFILGLGFMTYITFPGYYIVILISVASAAPWTGALVIGCYGAGRSLSLAFNGSRLAGDTAAHVARSIVRQGSGYLARMRIVGLTATLVALGVAVAHGG